MLATLILACALLAGAEEAPTEAADTAVQATDASGAEAEWKALEDATIELARSGKLDEARTKGEQAVALARRSFGDDDARTASSLTLLGEVHMSAERWIEAEPLLREGMAIRTRVLEPLHSDHEQSLNLLAMALVELDRTEEAERLHQQSIASAQKAADQGLVGRAAPRWTDLVAALQLQAGYHDRRGEDAAAGAAWARALAAVQKYGKDAPELQRPLLDELFDAAIGSDDEQAEAIARASLALARGAEGGEQSEPYADALLKLARVLRRRGDDAEAARLHEQAYAIAIKVFPADSPRLPAYLGPMARVHRDRDQVEDAERLLVRSIELIRAAEAVDVFMLADQSDDLANVYEDSDRWKLAEPLRREIEKAYFGVYGSPSWMVAQARLDLAENLFGQDRLDEAKRAFAETIEAITPAERPTELQYAQAIRRQVAIALLQGRLDEALDPWTAIVALRTRMLGADAEETRAGLRDLAALRRALGRDGAPSVEKLAAAPATPDQLDHALRAPLSTVVGAVRERLAAATTAPTAATAARDAALLELLAELLVGEDQARLATGQLEKALSIRIGAQGRGHADVRRTGARLDALYRELGDTERANDVGERAGLR